MEVNEYLYKLALLGEMRIRWNQKLWTVEQDRNGLTVSIRHAELDKALLLLLESANGERG